MQPAASALEGGGLWIADVFNLERRSEKETRDRELLEFFESRRIEGVIISPTSEYADRDDNPFLSCRLPIVVVDRDMASGLDSVLLDHKGAVRKAMDYLLSMGHRRIALYASGTDLRPGREKLAGYKESLAAAGLGFDPSLVHLSTSWIESSHTAMADMLRLQRRPTALIALAPRLLAGAMRVARDAGLQVPQDLSVIGMGTTESLELMYPPATALRYNYEQSAQAIVRLIIERVQGTARDEPRRVVVPWDLVLGSSCTPPPNTPPRSPEARRHPSS